MRSGFAANDKDYSEITVQSERRRLDNILWSEAYLSGGNSALLPDVRSPFRSHQNTGKPVSFMG